MVIDITYNLQAVLVKCKHSLEFSLLCFGDIELLLFLSLVYLSCSGIECIIGVYGCIPHPLVVLSHVEVRVVRFLWLTISHYISYNMATESIIKDSFYKERLLQTAFNSPGEEVNAHSQQ